MEDMDMSPADKLRAAKAAQEAARLVAEARAAAKKRSEPAVLRTGGGLIGGADA